MVPILAQAAPLGGIGVPELIVLLLIALLFIGGAIAVLLVVATLLGLGGFLGGFFG